MTLVVGGGLGDDVMGCHGGADTGGCHCDDANVWVEGVYEYVCATDVVPDPVSPDVSLNVAAYSWNSFFVSLVKCLVSMVTCLVLEVSRASVSLPATCKIICTMKCGLF